LYLCGQTNINEFMNRKSVFLLLLLLLMSVLSLPSDAAKKESRSIVRLKTTLGDIRIALSDLTPIHRDNFLRLVKQGYYDGILFHRVIEGFVIQAGDPSSRNATNDSLLANGISEYLLPAEIVFPELFHVRGSVAAAREGDDVNPEFRSSGLQFYIVWGRRLTPGSLKKVISHLNDKGIELDRFMISDYQMRGGTPHLDGTYTVFGEVIEGLDIVEIIQKCPTDASDRPLEDIVILHAEVESLSKSAYSTTR
jgi:peptidyl-prolyl cis-trans isomerase B (cyclophilin B)